MRITKVYTRTGDAGKTRLAGGQQVWKDSLRVEAYGIVDELNSLVGVVRAFNAEKVGTHAPATRLEEELRWVQNKLFDTGGLLATQRANTNRVSLNRLMNLRMTASTGSSRESRTQTRSAVRQTVRAWCSNPETLPPPGRMNSFRGARSF